MCQGARQNWGAQNWMRKIGLILHRPVSASSVGVINISSKPLVLSDNYVLHV